MTAPFRIVFVHGYTSSHTADWYPAITAELEKMDWDYVVPDLPGYKNPRSNEWLNVLHRTISQDDKPHILLPRV